jgi:hypothetical protein
MAPKRFVHLSSKNALFERLANRRPGDGFATSFSASRDARLRVQARTGFG